MQMFHYFPIGLQLRKFSNLDCIESQTDWIWNDNFIDDICQVNDFQIGTHKSA